MLKFFIFEFHLNTAISVDYVKIIELHVHMCRHMQSE